MSIIQVIAANNNVSELQQLCKQFRNKEFKKALKLRMQWDAEDLREVIAENEQIPCKCKCTTSYDFGDEVEDDTDWRERYESTREAPYGCLTEDDMKRAIYDEDLDTIEENPILANITLGNMLKENPEIENDLDEYVRDPEKLNPESEDELTWDELTDIPYESYAMIAPQRGHSPKYERKSKVNYLSIFA